MKPLAGSVLAAISAGADLTSGPNPYRGELADSDEARAWQRARDATEGARLLRTFRFRARRCTEVIEQATETIEQAEAERAEWLAKIAELTGDPVV